MNVKYIEYALTADALCIGERVKKGIFKPCVRTIPFSSITGALRERFGDNRICAVGKLDESYLKEIDRFRQIHVHSPRYRSEDVARVPLQIEFFTDVKGLVYMTLEGGNIEEFKRELERSDVIRMGAFKSKGFGNCKLRYVRTVEKPVIKAGRLQTRIPVKHLSLFGISEIKPVYGYLFEPETPVSGKYVKSLYEGSLVKGYDFLIEEEQ